MSLLFYKRKEIREALVENAQSREIAVRYKESFGKRPDILTFPNEVVDLAKSGATSFHASEELWQNPRFISTNLKRNELEKLRKGWDFVLDIDSPFWKISKITAWLIIQGLKDFDIKSISIKFSGNKGFHIGVPFESFPESVNGQEMKNLFPEVPRNVAAFLLDYITKKYIESDGEKIVFGKGLEKSFSIPYTKLQELTGKKFEELTKSLSEKKRDERKASLQYSSDDPKLKKLLEMEKLRAGRETKNEESDVRIFNPLSIIEVDTILISSRHLFRMPYSLHEKSGLVSLPFNPEKILLFKKEFAKPEIVSVSKHKFLDKSNVVNGEASSLVEQAMEFKEETEEYKEPSSFEIELEDAIPEKFFPPSIKKILEGVVDGRKRSLFILINFLKCVGWGHELIEKRIREWNEKNPEPLREQMIVGQLRYRKDKEKILPPNYDKDYYSSMGIMPTDEEKRFKNPVTFTLRRSNAKRKN